MGVRRVLPVLGLFVILLLIPVGTQNAFADIIYESATLGPTGIGGGFSLALDQFLGSRFSITETVEVSAIGGHMSASVGDLFGAIVNLSGPLPTGSPFTGSEVLASTVFSPGTPSSDVSVPLSVTLPPGDYAIIFGSGLFGATGEGAMPNNNVNTPEGSGSYFFWGDGDWVNGQFSEVRFTVISEDTDNTPPVITAPPDVTVECNEFGGATGVDLGEPTVSDNEDAEGDLVVENDAAEPFPLGPTTVNWQVTDTGGLTDSDTQTVTVVDTTDPDIDVPDGFMAIANTDGGWSGDIGQATATDVCSDVGISNDAPDVFPLGDTTVEWCATDEAGNKTCDTQTINVKPLPVDIDIKPGSDPNSINPRSMGLVPVAILGSDSFDVADVDVTTLAFGPSGATPAHDLTDSDVYASHLEDVVVEDGITDLVSHYKQKETGLSSGDTEACITGLTNGGIPFEGCDSVRVK